jgi:Zn-finger nucleic acid-binding protein
VTPDPVSATQLRCPNCGAAAAADATTCPYCQSRLATVACPNCFAIMFTGMKHCPRCGADAARTEQGVANDRKCPRCTKALIIIQVGTLPLDECGDCQGIWLDVDKFTKICDDQESRASIIQWRAAAAPSLATARADIIKYLACPECRKLMNRMNFAKVSGVIIDVCHDHGTWFDRDELYRVVTFVHEGGLDKARRMERERLAEEERKLRAMQSERQTGASSAMFAAPQRDDTEATSALGSLLKLFLT